MSLGLDDLRMMAAAVFEMFGLVPPELDAPPPPRVARWASVTLGDGGLALHVGLDAAALERFVAGFSDGTSAARHDPQYESAAICEVANVIGGNLRGVLGLTGPLGIPSLSGGPDAGVEVFGFGSDSGEIWLGLAGIEVHG
jgi:hypothetical protein